jgi:glycosyltransferase involved in cell wall biosynthesis
MSQLLFVTPGLHYPPRSGYALRCFHLIAQYARMFEVDVLAASFVARDEGSLREGLAPHVRSLRIVPEARGRVASAVARWRSPLLPRSVALTRSRAMRRAVEEAVGRNRRYGVVHVHRLRMIENVRPLLRDRSRVGRFVLDLDDWESEARWRQLALSGGGWVWRLRRSLEPLRLRRYESRMLGAFDAVYVASEDDRRALTAALALKNVHAVRNGVEVPPDPSAAGSGDREARPVMLFVGSMDYGPNIDAVLFFAREVLVGVQARLPRAEFWVVGAGGPSVLDPVWQLPGVRRLGFVEDLAPLYAEAAVVVVPVRIGGGTRIKVLEAAAHGKAIVSTSFGCGGLDLVNGREVVIADHASDIAGACVRFLSDREARRVIGRNARARVERGYRWDAVGGRLRDLLATP